MRPPTPDKREPPRDWADMYKVAFEASLRTFESQAQELSDLGQRAVTFLAFIATGTAVLIKAAIDVPSRDTMFRGLALFATVLMILCVLSVLALLGITGGPRLQLLTSGRSIISESIHRDISPTASLAHLYHDLVFYNEAAIDNNERLLRRPRSLFVCAVTFGAGQLIVWIALIWIRA